MSERWFAGDSEGLDADYSFVVRRWVREPAKARWGDVDYGESEPVAICFNEAERDQIIRDHEYALEDCNAGAVGRAPS